MKGYLFDTHALLFWSEKKEVSDEFVDFFDLQQKNDNLCASSINFWEIALLARKGKIKIGDLRQWYIDFLENSGIKILSPTPMEMIESTFLLDHHKDPFDRLLIAQAVHHGMKLVTKDSLITRYEVDTFWM